MLALYDSLSQQKKLLKKTRRRLAMFVCGPTVYDFAHIGHARTYIAFDVIARWIHYRGFRLFYLQNITDVDDKIIERARTDSKNPFQFARNFEKEYKRDMKALGIERINVYARANEYIPHIVAQVRTLLQKGYAYRIEGDGYYFDLSKFPEYGKLSRRTTEQAEDAVTRIDESIQKRNRGDFCLWKFASAQRIAEVKNRTAKRRGEKPAVINGEPAWNTELGWGRPGWHIEDTAITEHFFGPQYDIHGGGIDLKFPHHEAEIAQQEAASGKKPFVNIWMHTGHLLVKGKKMSKSLGNFITIRDFLKTHQANTLRYLVASVHYRTPFDYTETSARQADAALKTINAYICRLHQIKPENGNKKVSRNIAQVIKKFELAFSSAMDDDVNTPRALAAVFDLLRETEKNLRIYGSAEVKKILEILRWALVEIMGFRLTYRIPDAIKRLVAKRNALRHHKQWKEADAIRDVIARKGYALDDTPQGTIVLKEETKT